MSVAAETRILAKMSHAREAYLIAKAEAHLTYLKAKLRWLAWQMNNKVIHESRMSDHRRHVRKLAKTILAKRRALKKLRGGK